MFCNTFIPLTAEVYYSTETQNEIGGIDKSWTRGRSINASLAMSTNYKDQQIQAGQMMWMQDSLNGRSIQDPRIGIDKSFHAMTDIIITDIKGSDKEEIYIETSGPRVGRSTLYELAGCMPHNGPFGVPDYFKIVLKRSDDQEMD